ncbi:unnamed protein product [Caenorhabditis angaria]|uniref:Uncharacterized protein n=1 Tax=Caenorhabditis angaria TaxID=860376 RepID=A0A9P1IWB1_9PELO|nr:unnamed protein product [Caenorhabditis angaria]
MFLIFSEKSSCMGAYRYLLASFATYNIILSFVDCILPMAIFNNKSSLIPFLSGGFFNDVKTFGSIPVAIRGSFFGLGYGILVIHFLYRYIALFRPRITFHFSQKQGMILAFIFFILHGVLWFSVCQLLMYPDEEILKYNEEAFFNKFNTSLRNFSFMGTVFYDKNISESLYIRGYSGMICLTLISTYAVSSYVFLGYKIMAKLREHNIISATTKKQHSQLFRALVIQTIIPCFTSFFPTIFGWYSPILKLNVEKAADFSMISNASCSIIDPIAIIILLPNYRSRIYKRKKIAKIASISENPTLV